MPILEALADAGHQVTVISPFHTPKYRNVEEIVLAGAEPMILNNNIDWFEIQQQNQLTQLGTLLYSIREMFSNTYKELIQDEESSASSKRSKRISSYRMDSLMTWSSQLSTI